MKKLVMLSLKDEVGRGDLEEKLKQYPEYGSPEAVELILEYDKECIKRIKDYCAEREIFIYKEISTGVVFAELTEKQITQISSENFIEVVVDEPMIRGASSY